MSVRERRGFKSSWVVDVEDLSIKYTIKLLFVLTIFFLSVCFQGMRESLSVRHCGERLAYDETSEFIGSGGKPGASVRK